MTGNAGEKVSTFFSGFAVLAGDRSASPVIPYKATFI
jgi:hypothetical protein